MANRFFKMNVDNWKSKFKRGEEISDKHPLFEDLKEFLVANKWLVDGDPSAISNELDKLKAEVLKLKAEKDKLEGVVKSQEEVIKSFEKKSKE